MKTYRKILFGVLTFILVFSLGACKSAQKRNTNVPLGNLNTSSVIARSNDASLSLGDYYDTLRANSYDSFIAELEKVLFDEDYREVAAEINLNDTEITDTEQSIFDSVASELYGISNYKAYSELKAKDIETDIEKYIDTCANRGITITKAQCESIKEGEENSICFSSLPQDLMEGYLPRLALERASFKKLKTLVEEEKIEDEDGAMVNNTYYISDDNIESEYDNAMKNYGTYHAIIIQFNNLTEARNTIRSVTKEQEINDSNALNIYKTLYETYYNYRQPLDSANPLVEYKYNKNTDDLADISSNIRDFVVSTLEDGQYLTEPFNLNNKYIMVYRGTTVYDVNAKYQTTNQNEVIEWKNLKSEIGDENYQKVYAELKETLTKEKITSYTTTLLQDTIESTDIKIFDPYLEYRFETAYSDQYDVISPKDFKNEYIFTVHTDNKDINYSVDEFYQKLVKTTGFDLIFQYFKLQYVYQYKDLFYDEDELKAFETDVETALKDFKNNKNSSYPAAIGENTFLLANYGYSTKDAAIRLGKVASAVLNNYLAQSVFDEWATENHQLNSTYVNTNQSNILSNLLNAGNRNYANLFSINIDHILIFIDDNADGNPDDPNQFLKSLDNSDAFYQALLSLSQAIYQEVNCDALKSKNIMDILNYIVKAYNSDQPLISNPDKNWREFKKYNFLLRVESLSESGDTTQSNVSNYVEEFADYIKNLYTQAVNENLTIDKDHPIFYFMNSGTNQPQTADDLCATEYGFHMIVVNSYTKPAETKKTEDSDRYGYQKNIEVLLNKKEEDDENDNVYVVIENTYNDKTTEATLNQFFTYYVQKQTSATPTLDTNITNLFSAMFDEAITRYTSASFQNYLLFEELNIQLESSIPQSTEQYQEYLKKISQSYDHEDSFNDWYSDQYQWKRPYQK